MPFYPTAHIYILLSLVNTRWWTTTRTFLIMTSAPGNWGTSTDWRQKLCSRARETEHSWFETAAKQDATPAVLCTYQLASQYFNCACIYFKIASSFSLYRL